MLKGDFEILAPEKEGSSFLNYLIMAVCFCGWSTHLWHCFSNKAWEFLIAGAIFYPIGVMHGFYLWIN